MSGKYPLWVGLGAAALFGWLLYDPTPAELSVDAGVVADAAPTDGRPAAPEPAPNTLVWQVEGRAVPDADELRRCLESLDYAANVTGIGDLSVTWKGVAQSVSPGVRLATPGDRCHDAAGLHIATAWCLRADAATLVDPLLGRRRDAAGWPRPRADGGLPIDALLAVSGDPPRTRGLSRFGLPELEASSSMVALYRAAGAFLVGCDATADRIPLVSGGSAALTHRPGRTTLAAITLPPRPKPVPQPQAKPTSGRTPRARPASPAIPRPRPRPKPNSAFKYRD